MGMIQVVRFVILNYNFESTIEGMKKIKDTLMANLRLFIPLRNTDIISWLRMTEIIHYEHKKET